MKRSTATWTCAIFLIGIGGYAWWGLRPFMVRPSLTFEKGVPSEARDAVRKWHETQNFFGPEKFGWKRYFHVLAHPYEPATTSITAKLHGPRLLTCGQRTTRFRHSIGLVRFTPKSSDWRSVRIEELRWEDWRKLGSGSTYIDRFDNPIPGAVSTD